MPGELNVLLLGGTGEARALAGRLAGEPGMRVVSSLAGRTADPVLPAGAVRVGGFGGVDGLAGYLVARRVDVLVDATHPFAERMSAAAVVAARRAGVALLVLRRAGWRAVDGDRWHWAGSVGEAAAEVTRVTSAGARVFLTTGRQGLAAFAGDADRWYLIRCVDPPGPPLPARHEVLLARGPFAVDGELALLRAHRIDLVVSKDSGGQATAAKLVAARRLGVPVVLVRRPAGSPPDGVISVSTVDDAVRWLRGR